MTTTVPRKANDTPQVPVPLEQRTVRYRPLAEAEDIEISVGMVKNVLAVRSRSGREPGISDITKFMMLCKARQINPFVGDAYLLGYDSKDGTKWSLITAIQSLRKRAEANPKYRGTQGGVIVRDAEGGRVEREGAIVDDGEKLLGGWAKVFREDRTLPSYASVKLSVYDTGQSRWAKDPGGMIAKVAEAAALRQAFPSDLAGLYIRDEFEREADTPAVTAPRANGIAGLKHRLEEAAVDAPAVLDPPHSDADLVQDVPSGSPSQATPEELADLERESRGELFDRSQQYE